MANKVIKVVISGYYLIPDKLPDEIIGSLTTEEFIENQIVEISKPGAYDGNDLHDLLDEMLEGMSTLPTVKLKLKKN